MLQTVTANLADLKFALLGILTFFTLAILCTHLYWRNKTLQRQIQAFTEQLLTKNKSRLSDLQQVLSLTERVKNDAVHTSDLAVLVADAAVKSSETIERIADDMQQLADTSATIARAADTSVDIASDATQSAEIAANGITELAQLTNTIGGFVDVINKLARQANLLSLNATVEAARAGEAGRGFNVVAMEVKKLAAETVSATHQIATQISDIQNAVGSAQEKIAGITNVISKIADTANTIQSLASDQIRITGGVASNLDSATSSTYEISENILMAAQTAEQTQKITDHLYEFESAIIQKETPCLKT